MPHAKVNRLLPFATNMQRFKVYLFMLSVCRFWPQLSVSTELQRLTLFR